MSETVVQALLDPATYGDDAPPADEIELRETHISWLFLTPAHVYKVKKPVDLGFLDFGTLERRRHFCHEELRLNRRLSPSVYEAVVAICDGPAGVRLLEDPASEAEPRDDVLDYAVRMRRLPEDRWLVRLLESGEADRRLMHRIAHRLVGFHAIADTDEEITGLGALESVRRNTAENFRQTEEFVGDLLDPAVRDTVMCWTRAFEQVREPVFRRRESEGRIRDGHGDLHCAQICIENGIDFIDCIEFNRRFRCADVAADLAFTSMDLAFHSRPELADALVLEYMARSGDTGLMDVLRFYECYRAYTRGKVDGMLLRQAAAGGHGPERDEIAERARAYFNLARRYALPRAAALLLTSGPMASGKSRLSAAVAERLGGRVLRSDAVRKELAGVGPHEARPDPWGEGLYAPAMNDRTYDELHRRARGLLRAGHVVVLDASYRERTRRRAALAVAAACRVPALVLRVSCPEATLRERLAARRPGADLSDGRLELLDDQLRSWEPVDEVSEPIDVDTDGPRAEVTRAALEAIYRRLLAAGCC